VSAVMDVSDQIRTDGQSICQNGAWLEVTGVIIDIMQRSHHSLREIQNFGMFAMRHLGKLEVKIIMDLRGEWAVDQAEDFAGL
jgi:hypothetical protein